MKEPIQPIPELDKYVKKLNWYMEEHYPANKKITAEEWNALFIALFEQGNVQEATLEEIYNVILPLHAETINRLIKESITEVDLDNIKESIANIINNTTKPANSQGGYSAGANASAGAGGAIGNGAIAGDGFSGGKNAQVQDGIDAIQLGAGVNKESGTLKVYRHKVMNKAGELFSAGAQVATMGDIENIGNSQVIALGDRTIKSADWKANGVLFEYEFTDELFTNALVQSVLFTPDKLTSDLLNVNNIFIYSSIRIYQKAKDVAAAILTVRKKPEFDMVVDVKLQGTNITPSTKNIRADQIRFDSRPEIQQVNVQRAIEQVQANLRLFKDSYNEEKVDFAKLDENNKVPTINLPTPKQYIYNGYYYNGDFYTDPEHTKPIAPQLETVYVDLATSSIYNWNGTAYTLLSSDSQNLQEQIDSLETNVTQNQTDIATIKTTLNSIASIVYPVGSIYLSLSNVDPSSIFGGVWQLISNRFLLGAGDKYSLNELGGEEAHTLTVSEMPSHTHDQEAHTHKIMSAEANSKWFSGNVVSLGGPKAKGVGALEPTAQPPLAYYDKVNGTAIMTGVKSVNKNTGGGTAHNNMPPYLAVYMWQRTA